MTACLFGLVLAGCDLRQKRILVWHDWSEPESEVLIELLQGYSEVEPDLRLIVEYVPADEIEARFAEEVQSGFGADVLIGVDADRLPELISANAVHPITIAQAAIHGFDQLEGQAMESMAINGEQLGIPLAAFTDVLYFREGVTPPTTLDEIIDLAEEGHSTGIPVDFMRSYWGVDAFGGTVFGAGDTVSPDRGFVEWMNWLVEARPQPNVILDGDYETLRDYFATRRIDLFVGSSRELASFRSQLRQMEPDSGSDAGSDETEETADSEAHALPTAVDVTFGLTTLPSGDNEATGGFLEIEGMVINRLTDNLPESLALMEYLTNVPSQGRIARSGLGRIPINDAVSIDPTVSPMEAALVVQQRRSVLLPRSFQETVAELRDAGNEIYLQVARGLIEPTAAAVEFRDRYEQILAVSS